MAADSSRLNLACRSGVIAIAAVISLAATSTTLRGEEPFSQFDLAMFERPKLEQGNFYRVFQDGLEEIWQKALDRPDPELQRLVIDTLGKAHRRGLKGLEDNKPQLSEMLDRPDTRVDVLRAIAQTLVWMDASEDAEKLGDLSLKYGWSLGSIVEPALARWKSSVLKDAWLERVSSASAGQSMISMAIEGLGALDAAEAAQPLERLVRSPAQPTQIRILAARNLGSLRTSGLVAMAGELLEQRSRHPVLNSIVAIELLNKHEDPAAIDFVNGLVSSDSNAVQSRALQWLYAIDFQLVDQHADQLITSPDANVRTWIARAMLAKKEVGRVRMLASLLNDVNPSLRREVARGLLALAQEETFKDEVIVQTMEVLNKDEWRGCEQACWILGKLDSKPSGSRMVELLGHPRGEVRVGSAWGLTQLRVPEHLADMLDHAQTVYEQFQSNQLNANMPGVSLQMAHLFIAFGDQEYKAAEPLMRKYLPKNHVLGITARAAAAWAIGMLYVDNPQEELANILAGRLADVGMEPEYDEVRQMSAISIGRMKAESALDTLRQFAISTDFVSLACYWAIERMTGEKPPEVGDAAVMEDTWFLSPYPTDNE